MSEQTEKIKEICEKIVSAEGFFFIDLVFRGTENNRVIELFIDSAKGVSVDDCAVVSRMINEEIAAAELEKGISRFDVSSPGTDRPFRFPAQFDKHSGRKFDLICATPAGEEMKFQGRFLRREEERLFFEDNKKQEFAVSFSSIKKSTIILSFK